MAKRKTKAPPAIETVVDRGTPETRRRMSPGTMDRLITTGKVTSVEIQAAEEIVKVYKAATMGLGASQGPTERVSKSSGTPEPEYMVMLRRDRYLPWTRENSPGWTDITLSVLVDGMTARELDRRYRRRDGTCAEILVWSLRRYALVAGFVGGGTADRWRGFLISGKINRAA